MEPKDGQAVVDVLENKNKKTDDVEAPIETTSIPIDSHPDTLKDVVLEKEEVLHKEPIKGSAVIYPVEKTIQNAQNTKKPLEIRKKRAGEAWRTARENTGKLLAWVIRNDLPGKGQEEPQANGPNMRYIILLLSVLCLSSMMSNIICFNFTVLCMPSTNEPFNANHTYKGYSKDDRTMLFSSVAVGALVSVVPISSATHILGTRKVFFSAGLLSAICTLFVPLAARTHLMLFVAVRFFQGASFSACMPTVGSITSNWASLVQHGLFMSLLTAFGQLSSVFSMPLAGQLCSTLGWTSVYYLHGCISLLLFAVWYIVFRDHPDEHTMVSTREMGEINRGKSSADLLKAAEAPTVPYLQILTTPSVWGVWIGAFGDLVAVQLVHTFSPLYIREVLDYSVQRTGWTAALPVLFQFFVKVFAGHSSDNISGVSETTKLRLYNSVALGASALFMLALAFLPKGHHILGVVLITLTTAMFGFNGGGFNKCATLVSRQYSYFVMSNIQFIICLSMLICPILVNQILRTGSLAEWRLVYILHACVLLVCNLAFCLLATAKPAPWTNSSIQNPSKRNTPMFKA